MSKSKVMLPRITKRLEGYCENWMELQQELRAAEAVIRVVRRARAWERGEIKDSRLDCDSAYEAIDRALAKLDKVTERKP